MAILFFNINIGPKFQIGKNRVKYLFISMNPAVLRKASEVY